MRICRDLPAVTLEAGSCAGRRVFDVYGTWKRSVVIIKIPEIVQVVPKEPRRSTSRYKVMLLKEV